MKIIELTGSKHRDCYDTKESSSSSALTFTRHESEIASYNSKKHQTAINSKN